MAYCSVADVKSYLGISEATDDARIDTYIKAAQAGIDSYCNRTFEASADTTRYFDAIGTHIRGGWLYLDKDLCAITTVTNGDSVEVTSSEYTTKPRNETPYYAIRLLSQSGKTWTYSSEWMDAISIIGRWSYSTTAPNDIKQACIRFASYIYRQKDAQMFDVTVFEGGVVTTPLGMPPDVRTAISPYRRLL
jgi:hypothetical protein